MLEILFLKLANLCEELRYYFSRLSWHYYNKRLTKLNIKWLEEDKKFLHQQKEL
jgi:hypothetical protein